jgi:Secretion system C-terminal sorting domain
LGSSIIQERNTTTLRSIIIIVLFISVVSAQPSRAPLGINLSPVVDWSTELPFVDIFKSARAWIPQEANGWNWNTGSILHVRSDGWIAFLDSGQAAGTVMTMNINGHYPGGTYTCLYDGAGDLRFEWDAAEISRSSGRILLNVTPSNSGIHMKIVATDSSNPIRNIRVIMPGFENSYQSQPFNPVFLNRLDKFDVIRFMDWENTNNSPVQNWSDRATPSLVSQAYPQGVALEYMIKLANTLHANPWFCIPHQATDAYVTAFATMVRDSLDPSLKAYIEYSNEVWNGIFSQGSYAQSHGLALGLSANSFEAQLRFYSLRSVQVFTIFSSVFGGNNRLVRVLASQSVNPWTGTTVMDWDNASSHADVYAVAPYFGGFLGQPGLESHVRQMSVNEVLDSCAADIVRQMVDTKTNENNAESRGLKLVCYESGQGLVGGNGVENDTTVTNLFIAANRHPRMKDLYLDYIARWNSLGGSVMNIFNFVGQPSKFGSYGILEWIDQDTALAPKYSAAKEYLSAPTPVEGILAQTPRGFSLYQNFPNPFNPSTVIGYEVASFGKVSLKVYDLLGREVVTLVNEVKAQGSYTATFNASNLSGGVYFYRLQSGTYSDTKKLVLLK